MTNLVITLPAPVLINNAGAVGAPAIGQSYTDQRYPLMSRQTGNNNAEFMYVYASASIAQYLAVAIDASNGKAVAMTAANTSVGSGQRTQIGFTDQGPLQTGSYGWVSLCGPVHVKVKKGVHLKKAMFVSSTTGWLTSTLTLLASARANASFTQVIGIGAVAGTNIGVLGTASTTGDVRPFVVAAGGAWADKNVLHGFSLTT